MESSRLQNLAINIVNSVKENPDRFIEKMIPPEKLGMYKKIRVLLPMVENLLKISSGSPMKLDPAVIVAQAAGALETLPVDFWLRLEDLIRAVLDGDPAADDMAKNLFGVVIDAN